MIEAFRVGAVAGGRTVWEGLDLAFGDGEVWLVTGPPSCGKTLLLRILRGDRRPDFGDVVVGGKSLYRDNPEGNRRFRASSGFVQESMRHAGGSTVGGLFRLSALAGGGMPSGEREKREEELLSLVGLAGARGAPVTALSVSECARVMLAVELLRGPKVLFLDTVLGNAGDEWADTLGAVFRALAREGRTIILTERSLSGKWAWAKGGAAVSAPPFSLCRIPAFASDRKETSGEETPFSAQEAGSPVAEALRSGIPTEAGAEPETVKEPE